MGAAILKLTRAVFAENGNNRKVLSALE